jgi:hypothetical protein
MVPALSLVREFRHRKDRSIDLTAEALRGALQREDEIHHPHVPDDHEVDVTPRKILAARDRAMDERDDDPLRERCEGITEHIREPGGLREEALEFGKEGAVRFRLVVDLSTFRDTAEYTCVHELDEFALQARPRRPDAARELRREEPSFGM